MAAIGYVTFNPEKGSYKGSLRTLTIATGIEIVPNAEKSKDGQPDFRVYTDSLTELGAGWTRTGKSSGREYVSLTLEAPELGRRIFANLGPTSGQDDPDVFAILWNPES